MRTAFGTVFTKSTRVLVAVAATVVGIEVLAVNGASASVDGGTTVGGSSYSWTVQNGYPIPAKPLLSAVSCATETMCIAVGTNSLANPTLYQSTDGGQSWFDDSQSLPSGVSSLSGISCVSTSFCEAVGGSITNGGVALSYNGSTWSKQAVPSGVSSLSGISCVSTSFCEAVGGITVISYNGSTWSQQTVPSAVSTLSGISCVSTSFCEAVGGITVISYNGSTWSEQTVPSAVSTLSGISCASAFFCEAVGGITVISYNGSTWSQQILPSAMSDLSGVSCISTSFCEAVGGSITNGGVALSYNGSTWSQQILPSGIPSLSGVSCISTSFCEAVGASSSSASDTGTVISYNGISWSQQILPSGIPRLSGISCVSTSFCEAVGGSTSSASDTGTIISYNGISWNEQTVPSGIYDLSSISCVSTSFCEAVGLAYFGNTVAIHYNGISWSAQQGPYPNSLSVAMSFYSVSCISTSFCEAVGNGTTNLGQTFLGRAIVYNGLDWSAQQLPVNVSNLASVSCISKLSCEATGIGNSGVMIGLYFNGTSWIIQNSPSDVLSVSGVSCTALSSCEAVGLTSKRVVILHLAQLPVTTSVTPDSSPLGGGGTAVITGENFTPGVTVSFGSTVLSGSAVTVVSPNTIAVSIPPASSPGVVSIVVANSNGTSSPIGFIYTTSDIPYTPLTPYRIADTRCSLRPLPAGISTSYCSSLPAANQTLSSPSAGGSITLQVTDTGSTPITSTAQSVVLNITAIPSLSAHSGYLSVYPAGTNPPMASSLNYTPGTVVPNLVTATLGVNGAVSIYSSSANVNVVVDVEGYYAPSIGSTHTTKFTSLADPERLLDTRCADSTEPSYCNKENLPSVNASIPAPGATASISVTVAGIRDIPLTATAISLSVTAAGPSSSGYLTIWADSGSCTSPPTVSNVNFEKGSSSAGSVIVEVGGTGKVCIYNSASTPTNVVIDITGWFSQTGDTFTPTSPVRICDTRSVSQIGGSPDVTSGVSGQCANSGTTLGSPSGPITIQVTGIAGVPLTATAVVANITVVSTSGGGYLTAWAAGSTQPTTSNINWGKGSIVANMVVSALDSSGQMEIYCSSPAYVIVDVVGWYS